MTTTPNLTDQSAFAAFFKEELPQVLGKGKLQCFPSTREEIEEAHAEGAGIVIAHFHDARVFNHLVNREDEPDSFLTIVLSPKGGLTFHSGRISFHPDALRF